MCDWWCPMTDQPAIRFDLPAVYHGHDGPTEHQHEGMGPGHYSGEHDGHFHLTDIYTMEAMSDD